jgi:HD superfamily phosphohydrolase
MNFPVTSNIYKNIPGKGSGLYYDPIYGYVPLPGYIREAIDLDVFQRLRGIKQLSTVFLIFPGALHTRFDHCIGVNYLASIMFNKFRELLDLPKPENPRIDPILEASMKLSSLFHDIGHGPFCHTFEMFCKRNEKFNVWTHEKFAKKLITGKDESNKIIRNPAFQQIPNYLKKLKSQFSKKYRNAENLSLLNPENIYNISAGYPPNLGKEALNNKYYFLKDIIASCYGLDRLDYLKRDAYFSGVNTGNIDIGEIINNLLLLKHNKKFRLFLKLKSVTALETLLQARNLVYRRLYHNSVHRSAQELIIRGLRNCRANQKIYVYLLIMNYCLSSQNNQMEASYQKLIKESSLELFFKI